MNKVKNEYNPLSIDQQVKNRIEKHASGVTRSEFLHSQQVPGRMPMPPGTESSDDTGADLSIQFMNLLFSPDSHHAPADINQGHVKQFEKQFEKTGTNQFFFPHKEQEESNCGKEDEVGPFSLIIENTELGSLQLNGTLMNEKLNLRIQVSKQLNIQEKQVLIAILEKRLSHEIGIQMEIKID